MLSCLNSLLVSVFDKFFFPQFCFVCNSLFSYFAPYVGKCNSFRIIVDGPDSVSRNSEPRYFKNADAWMNYFVPDIIAPDKIG